MSMNAEDLPLDQIGPTQETIDEAVRQGFIPTPPAVTEPESTVVIRDKWGRTVDDPDYGIDPTSGAGAGADSSVPLNKANAINTLRSVLAQYQLESLTETLWQNYTKNLVDIENEDALIFSIKNETAYKQRFAANESRLKAGLPELDPATYIAMEDSYRKVLAGNGMPQGFYDSPDDFRAFIEGDVSVTELQNRVEKGYRMVADADPGVKQKMQELYGVSEGQLAAYFIDPERTRPLLVAADYQRQARAAEIAARAQEQAGISLTGTLAEDLARRGTTGTEAQTGFEAIGKLGELTQTFAGEQALGTEDIVRAQFGIDVQAQQELERRKKQRLGEFLGGGEFARTAGETSGAVKLGIGKSQ